MKLLERRLFSCALALALALAGCSTSMQKDYDTGWSASLREEFPARSEPARETKLSEGELLDQGYISIGRISFTTDRHKRPEELAAEIPRQAARKGADLFWAPGKAYSKSGTVTDITTWLSGYDAGSNWSPGYIEYTRETTTRTVRVDKYSIQLFRHEPAAAAQRKEERATRDRIRAAVAEAEKHAGDPARFAALLPAEDVKRFGRYYEVSELLYKVTRTAAHESIRHLLALGADPDRATLAAVHFGRVEVLRILLDAGAKARDVRGPSLKQAAAWRGHRHVLELLVERGADITRGVVAAAASGGHMELTGHLLGLIEPERRAGAVTAALAEIRPNDLTFLSFLLEKGADPDQAKGDPMLHAAARRNLLPTVRRLLAAGAKPDAYGKGGSAVFVATKEGHLEVAAELLAHGANPRGVLSVVASRGDRAFAEKVLAAYRDERQKRSEASIALGWAKDVAMVDALLAHGADPNLRGWWTTPFMKVRSPAIAKRLLAAGADVKLGDNLGRTALYLLVESTYDENAVLPLARVLLFAGSDPNARPSGYRLAASDINPRGYKSESLLQIAEQRGWKRVPAVLRIWGATESP